MNAKVKIESLHGDDEPIVVSYDGVWDTLDGEEHVKYGDGNVLTIRDGEVIIDENGQMKAHILLRPDGEIRLTPFETSMGTLLFGIETHYLRVVKISGKMVVEAGYSLLADGEPVNRVELIITVRRCR